MRGPMLRTALVASMENVAAISLAAEKLAINAAKAAEMPLVAFDELAAWPQMPHETGKAYRKRMKRSRRALREIQHGG